MGKTRFDVSAFNRRINAIPVEAREAIKEALVKGTDEAVVKIKANLPVGPDERGHIRDTVKSSPGRTELTIDVSMGSSEQPYSAALEWGHHVHGHHVPAVPVFFPQIRKAKKRTRARIRRSIKKVLTTLFGGRK